MGPMDEALKVRIDAGRRIVEEQIGYFAAQFGQVGSNWKYDGTRVTEADIHLSLVFADQIGEAFPEDQFFSEELDHGDKPLELASGFSWLVDPIDGTNNFARHIATCSISLALLHDGAPVYGFVYDHCSRNLLHGGPGIGAFVGDRKLDLDPSAAEINGQSIIAVQAGSMEDCLRDEDLLQRKFKLRSFGSSALHVAYAAVGWIDAAVAHGIKTWDVAAGVAILEGAGGVFLCFGEPVFPLKSFSTKEKAFGHIAAFPPMLDHLRQLLGR